MIITNKIDPNSITKGEIMETGEVCYYPILLQAIVKKDLVAVQKLLSLGANPYAHYYIIDQDQNCIYAISAKDMARKIHRRDFSNLSAQIYNTISVYCDEEK